MSNSTFSLIKSVLGSVSISHARFTNVVVSSRMLQLRDATALLQNVEIDNMFARTNSPFCAALRSNLTISDSRLYSVMSEEQGLIQMTDSHITFRRTAIQQYNVTFIDLTRTEFVLEDCEVLEGGLKLMDPGTKTKVTAGFLEGTESSGVVRGSYFKEISGRNGGCFALYSAFITILSSTFENCSASIGGGVVYANEASIAITASVFKKNSAKDGGSIYFACKNSSQCQCLVTFTSFASGTAVNGGVVKWTKVSPQMHNITSEGNKADYGDFEASFPTHMILLNSENQHMQGESGVVVLNPILIGFLDSIGQRVATDNQSSAELQSSKLIGTTYVVAENGIANFSAVIVQTYPATSVSITVYSQSIYQAFPDSKSAYSMFSYSTRNCIPGEVITQTGCYRCPSQSYSVDPAEGECRTCPSYATCIGGMQLRLDSGYWRSSELSSEVFLCPILSACLGGENATCADGFSGKLCSKCAQGYYLVGLSACVECESLTIRAVRNTFLLSFIVVFYVVFVRKLPRSLSNPISSLISPELKLVLDYLHSLMIISVIHVDWRSTLTRFFSTIEMILSLGLSTFPVECYWGKSHIDEGLAAVYRKSALAIGFPIGLLLLNWGVWVIFHCFNRSSNALLKGWQSSFFLISVLTPYVTKTCIQLVSCQQVEGEEYWLSADETIECWTTSHYKYVFALFLPAFFIYFLGVPLLLAGLLRKFKSHPYRLLLIYITSGYTKRFYYWEVLILVRKLLLILFLALLANPIWLIQNLASMTLLYLSLDLHMYALPYQDDHHNRVQTCVFGAQMVVIAVSFYLQAELRVNSYIQSGICLTLFVLLVLLLGLYFVVLMGRLCGKRRVEVKADSFQDELGPPPASLVSFEESQGLGATENQLRSSHLHP